MIKAARYVWHNGELIPWEAARIHVMSHVVNYGTAVFEGVRCYLLPTGPAIFRATDHARRLLESAKIYRMNVSFDTEDLVLAMQELVQANGIFPCYLRPIVLRGYGEVGINPLNSPIEVFIANYEWGRYLGDGSQSGVDVCVSSWKRLAANTLPTGAKAGANYMNSQLIRMEADINGYAEGIALDTNGHVSEGSGENVFLVRNGAVITPAVENAILSGITRETIMQLLRDLGIPISEASIPREMLYVADELFFTGTAAEVTPIRSVDRIVIGSGKVGRTTRAVQGFFNGIVQGCRPDRHRWMTHVRPAAQACS